MAKLRSKIPVQEAAARHAAGESLRSLAAGYGVTVHTLSRHLKRAGNEVRSKRDANLLSLKQHPRKKPYLGGHAKAARRVYEDKKRLVQNHRNTRGCQDCGFNHPAALDLHHLDPATKHPFLKTRMLQDGTGRRTYRGWYAMSFVDIEKELAKCIVLCSNCHRIREWEESQPRS